MIGKKINQLATELAPVSTDLTIIGDPTTGVSKKITLAQLGAIFSGAVSFYTNLAGFPAVGDINVIYCAKDTQKLYLWSGSSYVEVFPSQALLDTYQLRSEKGNANGYASLDSQGKVPISQLPSSIMEYKGTWSAATNTPTLANGTGDTGDVYICNAAGTVNFGAGPLTFAVGDYVIYSGTIWQRSSGAVGTVTSVAVSRSGDALAITGSPVTTSGTINIGFAGTSAEYINGAGNRTTFPTLLSSVGLSMPSAFNVANSPLTANGTIAVTGAGNATQYVRGDGVLATLPTSGGGGGASVSYYLNGSINQGTIGGVTYYEMNKTPIIGAGTDFTRSSNGYIASFLTDANDPALLNIPAGNFNFETYFQASSGGGSPTFYIELYKYDGTTFTLIASNSGSPKLINDGTNIEAYFSALAVPQTTLTLTDRLAIRIYVTTAGRTITLHTENGHLCQVITTFTTGLTALNGLTAQVQYFATGTSGSDFNISSATATHTFNLPTASSTNRGALASADWTTFNNKQNALNGTGFVKISGTTISYDNSTYYLASNPNAYIPLTALSAGAGISYNNTTGVIASTITQYTDANARAAISLTTSGTSGAATYNSTTGVLNVPQYAPDLSGYVPTNRTLTINGTAYDLSANRSWSVGTVTSVGLSSATSGVTIGSTPITTSGTITLAIATASGSQQGLLSSTDWTTFNNKQNALTNPVTGTGTTNYLPKFTGASTIGNSLVYDDGSGIRIGATSHALASNRRLTVVGASAIEAVATGTGGEPTIEMWQKHTAGDNVFAYFFTEAAATTRGYLQYDRSGNRLNLVGSGNGLLFTGAATFTSSVTANGGVRTTGANGFSDTDGSSTIWVSANWTSSRPAIAVTSNHPLMFLTNNIERMRLDASGNLGLGVTPSAWSGVTTLQIGNSSLGDASTNLQLTHNAYYDGGNWRYITSAAASNYYQAGGFHFWRTAPSGTAGNAISFTQAMTLNASGNLSIGNTNDTYKLDVNGTGIFRNNLNVTVGGLTTTFTGNDITFSRAGATYITATGAGSSLYIGTNNVTDRLVIASTGAATFSSSVTAQQSKFWDGTQGLFIGAFTGGSGFGAIYPTTVTPSNSNHAFAASSGATVINTGASGIIDLEINTTSALYIANNRNVGIGTTAPGTALQVDASKSNTTVSAPFNSDILRLNNTNATTNALHGILMTRTNGASLTSVGAIMSQVTTQTVGSAAADLLFYTATSDVITERMRITSGGALLIGTTTEGFLGKLQVAGSVAITGQYNTVLPSSSFSYFDGSGQVVSSSSNASALYLDTTWNTTGNPDGIYLNVTNTASGASSKLLNLKVGSVSQFSVSKAGAIQTTAPSSGSAQPWKLGSYAAGGTGTATGVIYIEINGQIYSIPALQGTP
jgi:hypothetical protein